MPTFDQVSKQLDKKLMPLGNFIKHITKMKDPALEFFVFFIIFIFLFLEMVMSTNKIGSEDSTFLPPFSVYSKFQVILKDFKNTLF